MLKYPICSRIVKAIYTEPVQRLYQGNPVIEALPEQLPLFELFDTLTYFPPYDEAERNYESYDRQASLAQIHTCFIPRSIHIEMTRKFHSAVCLGYASRNPLTACFVSDLTELSKCVKSKDSLFERVKLSNAISVGYSIFGSSGTGKSSAMNRIEDLYPQIIEHESYKGRSFHYKQIVWMKLDCPPDGHLKGLLVNFFSEFDRLTGDNTLTKFAGNGRASIDQLIPQMALIARRHSLGVMVIDEIQNLLKTTVGAKEEMLKCFKSLVNVIGVPIIYIGTPEAIAVLSDGLMNARRSTGTGAVFVDVFDRNSDEWLMFIRQIWDFQWTKNLTPITPEIINLMYDLSAGIASVAANIYIAVQETAIRQGELGGNEIITAQLIKAVARSPSFSMLMKNVDMIRNPQDHVTDPDAQMLLRLNKAIRNSPPPKKRKVSAEDTSERDDLLQESISIPHQKNIDQSTNKPLTAGSLELENIILKKDQEF